MKNAVINVKVDEDIKKRAYAVANSFGIPLSTLVGAYLTDLAETGQIHFMSSEAMTKKTEKIIKSIEAEIAEEKTSERFSSADDAIQHLQEL